MKSIPKQDVEIVIRSAGERTIAVSKHLLQKLFPENNITVIEVTPFSKAVQTSLEIGIHSGKPWLLCMDADVLVSETGVNRLLAIAAGLDEKVFVIKNLILDKFFPVFRASGIHLYRTSLAPQGITKIPAEGTSLRPETTMIRAMLQDGYKYFQSDAVVGIHDYEQYYTDIYRKCFLQAHKHPKLVSIIEQYWFSMAEKDFDFQVALWGSLSGKLYPDTVYVDKNFLNRETKDFLAIKNITEKPEIDTREFHDDYVTNTLKNYAPDLFAQLQQRMFPKTGWNVEYPLPDKTKTPKLHQKILYKVGIYFNTIGDMLKRYAHQL